MTYHATCNKDKILRTTPKSGLSSHAVSQKNCQTWKLLNHWGEAICDQTNSCYGYVKACCKNENQQK